MKLNENGKLMIENENDYNVITAAVIDEIQSNLDGMEEIIRFAGKMHECKTSRELIHWFCVNYKAEVDAVVAKLTAELN